MTKALMLAAGVGKRLGDTAQDRPKCLLEFAGRSLLQRHIAALAAIGVTDLVLALGYQAESVQRHLAAMDCPLNVHIELNPGYTLGSVVSLWTLRRHLTTGDDVLVMDADVLYGNQLLERLKETQHPNCFLLDRDLEAGDEPVKLCVKDGRIVEFRKQIAADLAYDWAGESVGFFRFDAVMAKRLAYQTETYIASHRHEQPHEEAIRDLLLAQPDAFGYEDITGLPWIEIDFPEDVTKAQQAVLAHIGD